MTRLRLEKGLILGSDKHVHSLNPLHFKWHAEEYRVIESVTQRSLTYDGLSHNLSANEEDYWTCVRFVKNWSGLQVFILKINSEEKWTEIGPLRNTRTTCQNLV